jgi:hypothetical protein
MGHGDFQWQFNNATEDTNYAVIAALSTAVQNYRSTLVGIFGEEPGQGGEEPADTTQTDPGTVPEGTIVATFDGAPSSDMFTVGGNYGDGKITYQGTYLKKGVKLDSKGSIAFTPQRNYQMSLVLATAKSGRDVKLNGTLTTVSGTENAEGLYYEMQPIPVEAGTRYEITKGSAESLVMMIILKETTE